MSSRILSRTLARLDWKRRLHGMRAGCVADLEMLAQCGSAEEIANRVEFLPL